jgi:predicted cation transporter
MASRFVVADNDVIEELKTSSENMNTRKSTNLLIGVFKKWAGRALRNIGEGMETYEVQELYDKFTINLRINFALYDFATRGQFVILLILLGPMRLPIQIEQKFN